MRLLSILAALAILAGAAFWWISRPAALPADFAGLQGDPEAGARIFAAAGCASCHVAPGADTGERPILSGGKRFESPFGTFLAPNISPHPEAGIGAWSDSEILHALHSGVAPGGAHLFPAFPYTAYSRAAPQDLADLVAHLRTLPPAAQPSEPHEVGFPFNIRRGIGVWKARYMPAGWVIDGDLTEQQARGRYLVEALAHCGECHTPRDPFGGLDRSRWLSGAPHPAGEGTIPNITPAALTWTEDQIADYLGSGFTPTFDTAGGEMAEVVQTLSRLPEEDRAAIAAYLKVVPPVD